MLKWAASPVGVQRALPKLEAGGGNTPARSSNILRRAISRPAQPTPVQRMQVYPSRQQSQCRAAAVPGRPILFMSQTGVHQSMRRR